MQQTLVNIIGAGVALCALAMLVQLWLWIAMANLGRRVQKALRGRARHFIQARDTFTAVARENREEVRHIGTAAHDVIAITRKEAAVVNEVRLEAERRYAIERERIELVSRDMKQRAEKAGEVFEAGIAEPWRDVLDFLRGLQTGYREVAGYRAREPQRQEPLRPDQAAQHRTAA